MGALGVVARPVATILEVASKTGQSIVNRSSPKQWRAMRIRLPRHLREDSPLLPYSWESAVGRAVLLETDGGCFRNEVSSLAYYVCRHSLKFPVVELNAKLCLNQRILPALVEGG